jgi:uncharacterized alpha-E superfamily protein
LRSPGLESLKPDQLADYFQQIRVHNYLLTGILDSTMLQDEGWHFSNLGRLIERADKTSRILDVKYFTLLPKIEDVGTAIDDLQWSAVLRSVSGLELYRKRFHTITVRRVVEFLVLEREFPRAIRYCMEGADRSLHAITGSPIGNYQNSAEQLLGQMRSNLAYTDVERIIQNGLHEFIDNLQIGLNQLDDAIFNTFFNTQSA